MIRNPKTLEEYYEYLKQTKKIRALEMQAQEKFWKEQEQIRKEKEAQEQLAALKFTPIIYCHYCQKQTKLNIDVSIDPPDSCECCGAIHRNSTAPQTYNIAAWCEKCSALIFCRDSDS